jgi:SPP1 gp7 family putative phage head morphogenesis protein
LPRKAPRKWDRTSGIPADPQRFEEAIDKFGERVPMKRSEWDKLTQGQREHAFMVSEVSLADVVTEVYEGIGRAVKNGTTFEEFKATAGQALIEHWGGEKPGRLETIFRTNVLTAYNGGRHAVLTAPAVKRARPYWRFDGIDDDRQSDICAELDGRVMAADDPRWAKWHPPMHHQCRSTVVPLSEAEAREEGIDDDDPDVDPQEGFGVPPAVEGSDWTPDLVAYPEEIRKELRARLKKG